jgi:hypothetical protein
MYVHIGCFISNNTSDNKERRSILKKQQQQCKMVMCDVTAGERLDNGVSSSLQWLELGTQEETECVRKRACFHFSLIGGVFYRSLFLIGVVSCFIHIYIYICTTYT